ncbi:LANO_0E10990g1_1 [Lachancea nothofagi CBS 11611]|uniref:LANO_0E10990g1_1 n=1 Tax=Lachancea nothofagi CBS 11611 TaxID=1266666 RepID=A0A1G4JXA1_9SACH|nr:LANO_0E10990g1_1 [Lachancea nothofagi CBS 11611]
MGILRFSVCMLGRREGSAGILRVPGREVAPYRVGSPVEKGPGVFFFAGGKRICGPQRLGGAEQTNARTNERTRTHEKSEQTGLAATVRMRMERPSASCRRRTPPGLSNQILEFHITLSPRDTDDTKWREKDSTRKQTAAVMVVVLHTQELAGDEHGTL